MTTGAPRYFARIDGSAPETGPYAWRDLRWLIKRKKYTAASQLREEHSDEWVPLRRVERARRAEDRGRSRAEAVEAVDGAPRAKRQIFGGFGLLVWIVQLLGDLFTRNRTRKSLSAPVEASLVDEECEVCGKRIKRGEAACLCRECEGALHQACEERHGSAHGAQPAAAAYRD